MESTESPSLDLPKKGGTASYSVSNVLILATP